MNILLDTNVFSELRKVGDGRVDTNVISWAEKLTPETLYISAISLMELEIGVRRKEHKDTYQGQMLRFWLDGHVIPFAQFSILGILHISAIISP